MTAIVHFFTFSGLTTAPVVGGDRYSTDSVMYLKETIKGRAKLECDESTSAATDHNASPVGSLVAYVQIQPGRTVYYEITPDNVDELVPADDTSRYASGNLTLQWGTGWRLSVLEKLP